MADSFCLLCLESQALAVERLLMGRTVDDKLGWLAAHGKVICLPRGPYVPPDYPIVYSFESWIGMHCIFFINGDKIVFFGDNTTWVAKERE